MKVFAIATITADGFIGKTADHLADWSSPEDKKLFVRLTKEAGVMVMGSRTFATIGRALPERRTIVYTSKPELITIEGIETTNEAPAALLARLAKEGVNGVAICGGAAIYSMFAEAKLIEELYITVEPVLFGTGISLFSNDLNIHLSLIDTSKLNDHTVLLHYAVK